MPSLVSNWLVDGDIDEQRYYFSETPIDIENLPVPKAVLTGDVRTYVDTDIEVGNTYYVVVSSIKDNVEKFSNIANNDSFWKPQYLNLALWLDAKDTSTLTVDLDNTVSEWRDKSGNDRHAVQNTVSLRPSYSTSDFCLSASSSLKSMNGVFTGITDGSINEYTLFIVAKPNKTNANLYSQSNSGASFYAYDSNNSIFFGTTSLSSGDANNGATQIVFSITTGAIALTETRNNLAPHLISRANSIGSGKLMVGVSRTNLGVINSRINGDDASGATASVNNLGWIDYSIFGQYTTGSVGVGDIYEILLVHNGNLGTDTIHKIEGFLAHKWGLLDSLPINHPYKTTQPNL